MNNQRRSVGLTGYLFGLSFFLLLACEEKEEIPDPFIRHYLIAGTLKAELPKDSILKIAKLLQLPAIGAKIKSKVRIYDIIYRTRDVDGKDIVASGIVLVPDLQQPVSMVSLQHGTAIFWEDVPSNFVPYSEPALFGPLFASQGYITVLADYIGYGASQDLPHPYEHRASLASSTLDMLRATKEFLRQQNQVDWNEKLYLTGYSEGGFATMCLQKKIEEEAMSEFKLTASSCGAGAYDKTSFMKFIINETTSGIAQVNVFYLWVLLTYNKVYKLDRPASAYFKAPHAQEIEKLGLGYQIKESFNNILSDEFKRRLNDGSDKAFLNAIADNDVYNWKSNIPIRLFHGDADPVVFYFNALHAEKAMKDQGSKDVKLITVKGGDHNSSVIKYLEETSLFFAETK